MSIIARSVPSDEGNRTSEAEQLLSAMLDARSPAARAEPAGTAGTAVAVSGAAAAIAAVPATAQSSRRARWRNCVVMTRLLLCGRNRHTGPPA